MKIFLLHGMGQWSTESLVPAIETIRRTYQRFSYADQLDFDSAFTVVPIDYDQYFREYIQAFNAQAEKFERLAGMDVPGIVGAVRDFAANDLDADDFRVSALGDLFLYLLTSIRHYVVTGVASSIEKSLQEDRTEGWGVVAHSLGTSVTTDVLQHVFTKHRVSATHDKFRKAYGKPAAVLMMANVASLARSPGDTSHSNVYTNEVYPAAGIAYGAMGHYINLNHALDPVPRVLPFDPKPHWDRKALDRFTDVTIPAGFLVDANVHGLTNYLRWPGGLGEFFNAMFRVTRNETFLGPGELEALCGEDLAAGIPGAFDQIVERLKEFKVDSASTWSKLRFQVSALADEVERLGNGV